MTQTYLLSFFSDPKGWEQPHRATIFMALVKIMAAL